MDLTQVSLLAQGITSNGLPVLAGAIPYIGAATLAIYGYRNIIPKSFQENGFWYDRYANTSFANPVNVEKGYKWANIYDIRKFISHGKRNKKVYIDDFRVDDEFAKKVKMNKYWRKKIQKQKIYFNPLDFTMSSLIIGKMGSGKSEFFKKLLSQKKFARAIVHEIKTGDFSKKISDRRSIFLNPYLEKGWIWDIMSESEGTIKTFFKNYMNALMGDKKDYFSATAERYFQEFSTAIKVHYNDNSSSQKWLLLIKTLKDFFDEVESKDSKSTQDVVGTMRSMIQPLELMAYSLQNENKKSFTIKEFFNMNNGEVLFLANQPEYSELLDPLFSAFIASVTKYQTSLPETKTDFTYYLIDEYLNIVKNIDENARKILHTLIRGHGGCLFAGLQYLPSDNKNLLLDLTSSAFMWMFFSTIEDETKRALVDKTECSYFYNEAYEKRGFFEKDKNADKDFKKISKTTKLLSSDILDNLDFNFEHITYIPKYKLLYKGYTEPQNLPDKFDTLEKTDLTDFYKLVNKDRLKMKKEDISKLNFEDLYKRPEEITKNERYKLFNRYEAAEDKEQFKKENNLVNVNFKLLFNEFMQNDHVLQNKMAILSMEERLTLYKDWCEIDDDDEKLDFIEKNKLWGALPGLFEFNDDVFDDY